MADQSHDMDIVGVIRPVRGEVVQLHVATDEIEDGCGESFRNEILRLISLWSEMVVPRYGSVSACHRRPGTGVVAFPTSSLLSK